MLSIDLLGAEAARLVVAGHELGDRRRRRRRRDAAAAGRDVAAAAGRRRQRRRRLVGRRADAELADGRGGVVERLFRRRRRAGRRRRLQFQRQPVRRQRKDLINDRPRLFSGGSRPHSGGSRPLGGGGGGPQRGATALNESGIINCYQSIFWIKMTPNGRSSRPRRAPTSPN